MLETLRGYSFKFKSVRLRFLIGVKTYVVVFEFASGAS